MTIIWILIVWVALGLITIGVYNLFKWWWYRRH